ncbi:MAG: CHASE3 domain-containing protein [Bacteroidota bacterium]|nr:CHASE3 domain-containing protein [Bacteroidota bacterium]MDP4211423.1 CHASE3 domain-containing protein [Bacteroidota bacterium]MDP4248650.1 CHASE3 domain-containing protein [Bacteroidota bacterium]
MKFDFPRKIRSGYLIAFLLLLFSYFLSTTSLVQLRKQNEWVDRTREVMNKLELLISYIKDAEIGLRGYIMLNDQKYLLPYYSSRKHVDSIYQILHQSVDDNPLEDQRVGSLRGMIDRNYRIIEDQLQSFNASGHKMNETIRIKAFDSKKLMDSIHLVSATIESHESKLLNIRMARVGSYNKIVFGIIIAAGTISILLIIYSLITFNIESRAKRNATLQAESYHDQLEKRIKELDSANRELIELRSLERFTSTGQIARVIAHEVRNPLTNIDLSASHLENAVLTPEDKKMFLDIISRNSKRINQLINELLSATKFSELKQEKISVNELLEETLHEARDRVQLNRISIEKKYIQPDIWLNVDRAQMKIALLNIIVNAIEATTPEKGKLMVESALVNGYCVITIRDNGKGMDAESLSKIFDPYFTSKIKGNGLGLTNTQNIVLNHKGKIRVYSAPGRGAEFVISLNVLQEENNGLV